MTNEAAMDGIDDGRRALLSAGGESISPWLSFGKK